MEDREDERELWAPLVKSGSAPIFKRSFLRCKEMSLRDIDSEMLGTYAQLVAQAMIPIIIGSFKSLKASRSLLPYELSLIRVDAAEHHRPTKADARSKSASHW